MSQDVEVEKPTSKMRTSTSLPSRRHFLNPIEEPESRADEKDQIEKVEKSPKTRRRQLQRSNTEIEMTQTARFSHFLHKLIPGNHPPTVKSKKNLEKMWQETYIGMCNRAVVLNHAILKAERDEATVKPVSLLDIQAS